MIAQRSRDSRWQWCLALLIGLGFAPGVSAQLRTRPIGPVVAEFAEPFTTISGVRELKDGRVLVSDAREQTLQLIDFARRAASPVGRKGSGPAEWANIGELLAFPGDTTWMRDFANNRFFVIKPDGTPGPVLLFPNSGPLAGGDIESADNRGRVLRIDLRGSSDPREGSAGVAHVLVADRGTGRIDTVAMLEKPKGERSGAAVMPGGMLRLFTNLPFAAQDLAALSADGRVVVVRTKPYRVEWFSPTGQHVVGPNAEPSNIRIDADEKEAFTRSQIRPGSIVTSGPTNRAPAAQRRSSGTLSSSEVRALIDPNQTWPAFKPPFLDRAVRVSPEGHAWVLRTRAWNDSIPVFDVFDGAGRVVERVALPKRTRLVGFGAGVAYLARSDDDDLVWLQRVRRQ